MFLVQSADPEQDTHSYGRSTERGEAVAIMCAVFTRSGHAVQVIDTDLDDAVVAEIEIS